jgi:hypothetical protein
MHDDDAFHCSLRPVSLARGGAWRCAIVGAMLSPDTDTAAAMMQEEAYRHIGQGGRLRVALQLSDLTHSFAIAGVKERFPGITEEEARRALASILYNVSR